MDHVSNNGDIDEFREFELCFVLKCGDHKIAALPSWIECADDQDGRFILRPTPPNSQDWALEIAARNCVLSEINATSGQTQELNRGWEVDTPLALTPMYPSVSLEVELQPGQSDHNCLTVVPRKAMHFCSSGDSRLATKRHVYGFLRSCVQRPLAEIMAEYAIVVQGVPSSPNANLHNDQNYVWPTGNTTGLLGKHKLVIDTQPAHCHWVYGGTSTSSDDEQDTDNSQEAGSDARRRERRGAV
jgi:hypothetical protein